MVALLGYQLMHYLINSRYAFCMFLVVYQKAAHYAASDTADDVDCHYSGDDRSITLQLHVASYSDMFFSFATFDGTP